MPSIEIRLVDAAQAPDLLDAYRSALTRALARHGYPALGSTRAHAWNEGECALILAFSSGANLVAGVRLQRHVPQRPMPCIDALRPALPHIDEVVENDVAIGGCGEACGLWVSQEHAGSAVATALMHAAMSQSPRWCGSWIWGICPTALVTRYLNVGYNVFCGLGDEGRFWYEGSNERERSWILRAETRATKATSATDRELQRRLRDARVGDGLTVAHRGGLTVKYSLG